MWEYIRTILLSFSHILGFFYVFTACPHSWILLKKAGTFRELKSVIGCILARIPKLDLVDLNVVSYGDCWAFAEVSADNPLLLINEVLRLLPAAEALGG